MAGELESLQTAEDLKARIARHGFDRLIMLSDGVFAIAITLLALEIKPPSSWNGELWDLLQRSWRSLFGFGLSFFIVGYFWLSHQWLMARVLRVDAPFKLLTLLLLAFVVMTPFATELMALNGPAKTMLVYCLLVALAGAVQAALFGYAAFGGRLLDQSISRGHRLVTTLALCMVPILFLACGFTIRPGATTSTIWPLLIVIAGVGMTRRFLLHRVGRQGG